MAKSHTCHMFSSKGAFLWDYSGYSSSALWLAEYTEFQFRKNVSSENGIPMAEVTSKLLSAHGRVAA